MGNKILCCDGVESSPVRERRVNLVEGKLRDKVVSHDVPSNAFPVKQVTFRENPKD